MTMCLGWGFWQESVLTFPTDFSVTGFTLARDTEGSQLVSEFLIKEIYLCCQIGMSMGKGESKASYLPILLTWVNY